MSFLTAGLHGPSGTTGVPKDAVVSLPGGATISLTELQKLREGGASINEDDKLFLGKPELLLAEPKKGSHYAWPLRTAGTAGKCRSGMYRKVKPSELSPDTPYEITVTGDPENGQVEWNNHILVEISEEAYKRHFVAPLWRGTEQLARLQERMSSKAEQLGLHITPEVTATPVAGY